MATKLERNRKAAEDAGYIDAAYETEKQYGIPTGMLVGLLEQESAWRPSVITGKKKSRAGAIGIAQFMPDTAADEGVDPLDPKAAIAASGKYLARLKKSAGSWTGALTSYNWGIGNYKKWVNGERKDQPKEAREYANKVQERAKNFGGSTAATPTDAARVDTAPLPDAFASAPASAAVVPESVSATPSSGPVLPTPPTTDPASTPLVPVPTAPTLSTPAAPATGQPSSLVAPSEITATSTPKSKRFEMNRPKQPAVTVSTPAGPHEVRGETPEEDAIIRELATSGETQLLNLMPELLQTRDVIQSKPLISNRGDATDRLLASIVDGV